VTRKTFRLSLFFAFVLVFSFAAAFRLFAPYEVKQSAASLAAHYVPQLRSAIGQKSPATLESELHLAGLQLGQPALLRIFKQESELEIWLKRGEKFEFFKIYPICKWSGQLGPKLREGDGQAPEGFYEVTQKQLNPNSRYHLAMNIGFPNAFDVSQTRTGSALMIHGSCVSIGCYAMTDAGIEDIYKVVEQALSAGQRSVPIHIFPFRMTQNNMNSHASSAWISYWKNLAEGDALFQKTRVAPDVWSCGGQYHFGKVSESCERVAGW
jgi:murein L,D-transpeptidase YafK